MVRENREVKIIKPTVAGELNNSKLRVAAYCRVSTNSEDQNNSFLAQLKYYNDYARLHPEIELVDIYADEGITGTCISKREEFRRMMLDASIGKLDRVCGQRIVMMFPVSSVRGVGISPAVYPMMVFGTGHGRTANT